MIGSNHRYRSLLSSVFILFALFMGACATSHSTRAVLLVESKSDPATFAPVKNSYGNLVGNNPIYVDPDGKFLIRLKEIRPGWIHEGSIFKAPAIDDNKNFTNAEIHSFMGKEIWLISYIRSLDSNDPLEIKSKEYYHASNVKLDSASFVSIPLDDPESLVFVHNADSSYRVEFRVYSVEAYELKRQLAKFVEDPGISGLIMSGWSALKAVASSTVGAPFLSPFLSNIEKSVSYGMKNQLLMERALLEARATIEFQGGVNILLDQPKGKLADKLKKDNPNCATAGDSEEYVLYDPYKPIDKNNTKLPDQFNNRGEYSTLIDGVNTKVLHLPKEDGVHSQGESNLIDQKSYIRFEIVQSLQPEKALKQSQDKISQTKSLAAYQDAEQAARKAEADYGINSEVATAAKAVAENVKKAVNAEAKSLAETILANANKTVATVAAGVRAGTPTPIISPDCPESSPKTSPDSNLTMQSVVPRADTEASKLMSSKPKSNMPMIYMQSN